MVKVVEFGNPTLADSSNAVFTILPAAQSLTLTNPPSGGAIWAKGSTQNITWASSGISNVKIKWATYSTDETITTVAATPATYAWTIPTEMYSGLYMMYLMTPDSSLVTPSYYVTITDPVVASLSSIQPSSAIQGESKFCNIYGQNTHFVSGGTQIWLSDGTTNISGTGVIVEEETYVQCTFDFNGGQPAGVYDLHVYTGADGDLVLNDAFTLNASTTATLELTAPNGGENWTGGTQQIITWTSNDVTYVDLYYSTNNGQNWTFINDGIQASLGSYIWTVPSISSTNCLVKILNTNDNSLKDSSTAVFTIYTPTQPEIISVTPNSGTQNQTYNLTIQSYGMNYGSNDTCWLSGDAWIAPNYVDAINSNQLVANFTFTTSHPAGTYQLIVNNTPDGTYVKSNAFTLNAASVGTIAVTSPNGGENWTAGTTQNITWTSSNVSSVKIKLWRNAIYTTIAESVQASLGTYEWSIPSGLTLANDYYIFIMSSDSSVMDFSDNMFTVTSPATASITLIEPSFGTQGQTVWCDIYGSNTHFVSGQTQIWLSQGGNNINGISINVEQSDYIQCQFVIPADQATGVYNINVYTAIDGTVTKYDAFTINGTEIPSITLTAPNGGETWYAGSTHNITWSSSNVSNVIIDYTPDGGISWYTITNNVQASLGTYAWLIPNINSSEVKVYVTDAATGIHDMSDEFFTITQLLQEIVLSNPSGGEVWDVETTQEINWTASNIDLVNIYYSYDNGYNWHMIADNISSSMGTYLWLIPNTPSSQCKILVEDASNSSIADTTNVFTINQTVVTNLTVISPNGGEMYNANSTQMIYWTSSGNVSDNLLLNYTTDMGASWTSIATGIANNGQYEWTVPNMPSVLCFVKITDLNDPTVKDSSDLRFTIAAEGTTGITITGPNGGETWLVGSGQDIMWTYNHFPVSTVSISYSTNNGATWTDIDDNASIGTSGNGSYFWEPVPNTPSVYCKIKVTDNSTPSKIDVSDNVFSIVAPSITVQSPNGGEVWQVGSQHEIIWSNEGDLFFAAIEYSTNNGSTWTLINDGVENTGSYLWTVPNTPSYECLVRVYDAWGTGLSDTSDNVFRIATQFNPTISLTSPIGDEVWETGSQHEITWTSTDVTNVKIEYTANGGTNWTTIVSSTLSDGSFFWTVPNTPSYQCQVRVSDVTNAAVNDANMVYFEIAEPSNASVTLLIPNGGQTWIAGNPYNITWNSTDITNLHIELSTNSGSTWQTLNASAPAAASSWTWNIPSDMQTKFAKIRLSDASNANVTDQSDNVFYIEIRTIAVTNPNGGENLTAGQSYNITWSSFGAIGYFKIEYSTNYGLNWSLLTNSAMGSSYNWTVPNAPSQTCLVRISDSSYPIVADTSNQVFTITAPQPYLTSINPSSSTQGNNTWLNIYANYGTFQWGETEVWLQQGATIINGTNVNVETSNYVQAYFQFTTSHPAGYYDVYTSDPTSGNLTLADGFYLNELVKSITVNSPNGGETWYTGNVRNITWSSTGVANVNVEYTLNNGTNWVVLANNIVSTGTYAWTIPAATSSACKVRVTDAADNMITDMSNNMFSIVQPSISLTQPNGGETWTGGTQQQIIWTSTGLSSYVNIQYSTNSGTTWANIANGAYNNGLYYWTIPNEPSTTCLVRVADYYNAALADTSNAVFTILPTPPSVTLTSPNGGETWLAGSAHYIYWNYINVDNVLIEYSADNGATWSEIIASTPAASTSYLWTVPDTSSIQVKVRITDTETPAITDMSNSVFTILNPEIALTSPNGSEDWTGGTVQQITWASEDVNYITLQYSTNNGANWSTIANGIANNNSYSWTVPNTPSTQCLVKVYDYYYSTITDQSDAMFTINQTPPSIAVTSPNGGETWLYSNSQYIYWNSVSVNNVKISYSTNNGTDWSLITASTPASNGYYYWAIPNTPSTQCKVKVEDVTNVLIADESNNTFTIAVPSITVLSPNGGEVWTGLSQQQITWTSQHISNYVTLEYSLNNGSTWNTIYNGLYNNGSYNWNVPNVGSTECLVRVKNYYNASIFDVSDAVFTIEEAQPSITLNAPNGGQNLAVNTNYEISWSSVSINTINIEYSTNNGADWISVATEISASQGYYNWNIPNTPSFECLVRVSDSENAAMNDASNTMFGIVVPVISLTAPNGGEEWTGGEYYDITWTSNFSSNYVNLEYSTNNGISWIGISNWESNDGMYQWFVPNTPSENCLVRVKDSYTTSLADTSDAVFTIIQTPPSVTLNYPNGYETFIVGNNHNITWSSVSVDNVKLEYSTNNGTNWITIISSVPASQGYYNWTIPNEPSVNCLVRVSDATDALISDVSNNKFSIVVPVITVTTPNGGEIWTGGTYQYINWTSAYTSNYVTIEYSIDNGTSWNTIVNGTYNDGSHYWLIPDNPSQLCLVRIKDYNNNSIFDVSNAIFTLLPVPPSVTVTYPNGYESLLAGATTEILWNSYNVNDVKIEYTTNNGASWEEIVSSTPASSGMYPWLVPAVTSSNCRIRITNVAETSVIDMSNNMFTITTPYIIVTTPNGGQTWGVGTNKTITWNSAGVANVRVEYTYNNGASWTMITSNVANTGSYNWTVPNTPSTQCRVRVRDANNLTVFDVSDNTFTIPFPTVNLVAPNGGQVWAVGSTQYIYWNSTSVSNVKLEYTTDGAIWNEIIATTPASAGSYAWIIPNAPSVTCKVRVSNVAQASINDVSDTDFSIIIPTITVTTPNGGESWMVGSTQNITWTHVAANSYVILQYSTDAGSTWANVDNYEFNDGSFAWVIPNTPSTDCKVRVIDYINSTVFGESQNIFTIAAGQPSVALISPNGGESWTIGSTREIRWNSLNVTNVKLEYSYNNGSSWQTIIASTPAASGSYFWTIPNTPSINCKVRVRDNATPTVFDVSDAVFTIPFPSITVNNPNGGESWGVGSTHTISWSAVSVQTVNIDYSTDNGTNWISIETGVAASSGSYSWTIPNTPSTECLVKVSHPTLSSVKDMSNAVFTILAPSVALTTPNGGETWDGLSSQNITWTSQGLSGYVKLEYTTDNGLIWNTIAAAAANNGSYLWSVPNVASVDCKIKITDYNNASLNDESDDVFIINMINPSITLLAPNGGENWLVGSANYISWTSVAVNNVKIEYSTNDVDWTIISNNTPANAGSFYWLAPNTPSETCKVRISSVSNGTVNDVSENYFSISQPVPTLTVTSPNGGEIWYVGDYNYITWSSNVVQNVRIDISYNNGSSWTTITSSTPAASGSYYYLVPNTPSTNCKVRIRDAASPSLVDMSNAVFRIQAPVVNNNQIYVDSIVPMSVCKGDTIKVYYTATGVYNAGNQFKLQMSGSNGNWSSLIELGSEFTEDTIGYVAGIIPETIANDSTYKVRVLSSNLFKVGTESDTTFTVNSPEFDFYADNTLKYLPEGEIQFFYQGVDTNVTYAWDFGNNATGDEANPFNSYNEVGFYTVNLTATNASGCATTVSKMNYIDIEQIFPTIPIAPLDSNDLTSILMVDAFTGFAVGNNGALVMTTNGAVTWSTLNSGTSVNLTNIGAIDTANVYITGENGLIMKTEDGGLSWAVVPVGTNETFKAITFHGANEGWAVGTNGTIFHYNGTTWSPEDINGVTVNLNGVYIDTITGSVYVVGDNGSIFMYDGNAWTSVSTPVAVALNDIGFANEQYGLAVGENGTILRTSDGGTSWDLAFNGLSSPFTRIQIANPDTAWAVGRQGMVYQTIDGGQTFFRFSIGDTIDLNGFSYVNLYTGSKATGASAGGRGVIVGKEGVAYRFGRDMLAVFPLVDTVLCLGSQINVEFGALGAFNPGNTFTLELSDASGDFANATVLGSYSGVESNVFNVTVPETAGSGSGYLLRVNSTDALITGESSIFGLTFVALPVVELGNDTSVCAGDIVTLNSNATDEQILWSTGETSVSIDVNATDTVSVTLTNFAGCQATDSRIVNVVDYSVVSLGIDTAICENANLVIDAGNAGAAYAWSTTESTQTISVAVADTFIVEVTNATGCATIDSIVVDINPVPVVTLGNDTTVCEGVVVTIDAGNTGLEFLWSNNEITQTVDVIESNTYIVTVTNSFGCEGTDDKVVTVNTLPVVSLGNDTIICANSVITLDAENAGASYLWSTNETSQTIDVAASDTIIVIVTDANTCSSTDSIVITVNDLPVVSIEEMDSMYCEYDGAVTLSGLPTGGVFSGTGVIGTTFDPAVADSGHHTIVYTYVDTYGCENSDSLVVFVDPCVSVADVMFEENYSIYPNPVTTHAFVEFLLGKPEAISIKMIDVLGKEVMVTNEEVMPSGRHTITLDTENLTSGTYMIILKKSNQTYQKVVVK